MARAGITVRPGCDQLALCSTHKLTHQTSGCKIGMKEGDQKPLRKYNASSKDDSSWCCPHILLEGVETSSRHDESADHREQREKIYAKKHSHLAAISSNKEHSRLRYRLGDTGTIVSRIPDQVWIVHGTQGIGVLRLVLLHISGVNPFDGFHKATYISRKKGRKN